MRKELAELGYKPASGSVQERNGTLYACIRHFDVKKGRRVQFMTKIARQGKTTKGDKMTLTDARCVLADMLAELDKELYQVLAETGTADMSPKELERYVASNTNFYEYVLQYLKAHPKKVTTTDGYLDCANAKIKEFFYIQHQYKLRDVDADVLNAFFEYCSSAGLKGTTIKKYRAVLSKPIQQAYRRRLISENPLEFIDEISEDIFECDPLNFIESVSLSEALNQKYDPVNIAVQLALFFGLRRSEVLGLRWSSIDFDERTIFINRSIVSSRDKIKPNEKRYKDVIWQTKVGDEYIVFQKTVKNKTSRRKLPIYSDYLFNLLQKQKKMVETNRALFGKAYDTRFEDFVCVQPNGTLLGSRYVSDHFAVMLKRMGIRKVRFHDLRHTFATHMICRGKVSLALVQQWLGHSSIETTIKFYSHLNIDDAIATGKTIEKSEWFKTMYTVIDDELKERASLVACVLEDKED